MDASHRAEGLRFSVLHFTEDQVILELRAKWFNNNRRLLPDKSQEAVAVVAMAPSENPCLNPTDGQCQQAPSTLILIISGMCGMMFLVIIAIVLLCCSHFRYRHTEQRRRQASSENNGPVASAAPIDSSRCDNMVLVVFPGEKYPVACARPRPLSEVDIGFQFKRTSSNVKEEDSLHIDIPGCRDQ